MNETLEKNCHHEIFTIGRESLSVNESLNHLPKPQYLDKICCNTCEEEKGKVGKALMYCPECGKKFCDHHCQVSHFDSRKFCESI